jgi:RimJ/RimL family protein N-acetyltransferase
MLRGELVGLRAKSDTDTPILDEELHDDVVNDVRSGWRAWRPVPPGAEASRFRVSEPADDRAHFAVVELATGTLVGEAQLASIDSHNRSALVGLALRPDFRGKGLGTDIVRVLCHYAFVVLGLHSVRLGTLADNHGMIKAAERAGFTLEGVGREVAWIMGEFVDGAVYGLLASEWSA